MAEEETDIKFHSTFERKGEFIALQAQLLSKPLDVEPTPDEQHAEAQVLQQLSLIFDVYQEQNYLWDRYLESLVLPVVDAVKAYAKDSVANPTREWSSPRVRHLSHLLHNYARFRGYKAIIRYFPHEIADLSIALDFILLPNGLAQEVANQWALRYAILIWLSLICMIPFDLAQFDEVETPGKTASSLELVAKQFLGKAGLEREAASLLLSRLYIRADGKALFQEFLTWSSELIQSTAVDPFLCIGILRVFSEVAKSGSADQVVNNTQKLLDITKIIEEKDTLFGNTIIRKMRMKLFSRVALRALPPRYLRRRGRELVGVGTTEHHPEESGDETPVPDVVETVLAELFEGLHDRDTLIRYSSAKGVARISERLSMDNVDDVLENIMSSFETHSAGVARIYDMPAIAESTWHGACLACAEMARRSLVSPDKLPKLIEWLSQALYFDLRKGAHSIGSNVRDAAAYVLWALARTQGHSALVKYANELASRLVTVALFDREIPIRRAASAAFQEYVGRTGLFPHGIDVLRKTDFYVVSIRKNAFLVAAPQVAEHPEYRSFLFDHLLDVSIRHWDISMRQLASQSLRLICSVDLPDWAPKAMARVSSLLESIDVVDVHGALLALTELAIAYKESGSPEDVAAPLRNIHNYLSHVSQEVLYAPRNEIITAEACRLLASAITSDEIVASSKSENPPWLKLLDSGLKHKAEIVQIEAANALREITRMADCTDLIRR